MKRKATELKNEFAKYISNKGLMFRTYEELPKLNGKKTNNPGKYWKLLHQILHQIIYEDGKQAHKRYSASVTVWKRQIKIMIR